MTHCVTGCYNHLDEYEADGCRLRSLYPRMLWDMLLENVGLLRTGEQQNPGSQFLEDNYLSFCFLE